MAYINYGVSTVNHHMRSKLGVTADEYCILDYLSLTYKKVDDKIIWDALFVKTACKRLHYSPIKLRDFVGSLIKKKLLKKSTQKDQIVINWTQKAFAHFTPNDDNFEELWELLNKNGNKQQAKKAYSITVKSYSHDFLMTRSKLYLEHLEITGYNQLHVSTFLNPQDKHFLNEFKTKKKSAGIKDNFFDS